LGVAPVELLDRGVFLPYVDDYDGHVVGTAGLEGGADEGASRPLGVLGVGGEDHQHHGFGDHVREAV
jgi:hypothetical protein